MTLSAEVQELLSWDRAVGARCNGLPVHKQRAVIQEALEQRAAQMGLVVESVARVEDLAVPVGGDWIRLRVYTPFGEGPHPAFLHIHGGGFVNGSIDWIYNAAKCAHICASAGCVVATVEYRLAPEFPFPTATEDCYSALCWLVEHAEDIAIDPKRIAVGGESAGGNLAAVLALMVRDRGGASLSLQMLEVPVTDMSERSLGHASLGLFGDGYGLDRENIESFTADYLPDLKDRDSAVRLTSPRKRARRPRASTRPDRRVRPAPRQRRGIRATPSGGRRQDDAAPLYCANPRLERPLAVVAARKGVDGRGRRCDSGCSLRARHRHMIEIVGEALIDDQT